MNLWRRTVTWASNWYFQIQVDGQTFRNVTNCLSSTTASHPSITPPFKPQGSPVDMSLYKLYYVFCFLSHIKRTSEKTLKSLFNSNFVICQETAVLDLSVRQLHASLDKKCTYFHHHNAFLWQLIQLSMLNDASFESRHGLELLVPYKTSRPAVRFTQPPMQWVPGLFPDGKAVSVWSWPFASI